MKFSQYVVLCIINDELSYVVASSTREAQSILSLIPKENRRGVCPLYTISDITKATDSEEDI